MTAARVPADVLRDAIDISRLRGHQRRVDRLEMALADHLAGQCAADLTNGPCAAETLAADIVDGRS